MAITVAEVNAELVGKLPSGTFAKNISQLRCVASIVVASKDAAIQHGTITVLSDSASLWADVLTFPSSGTTKSVDVTIPMPVGYTGSFYVQVTLRKMDWTGYYVDESSALSAIDYALPAIAAFSVRRANASGQPLDDGTRAIYTASASVGPLNNTNTANYKLLYRETGASTWTTITLATSGYSFSRTNTLLAPTFAANKSYEFQFVVTDSITNAISSASLGSAYALWHFNNAKNGIGVGKYSETENLFDVGLPARFRQGVQIDGGLTLGEPLPKTSGGLGADVSAQDALLEALGIRRGVQTASVAGSTTTNIQITFSPAFSSPPTIVLGGLQYYATGKTNPVGVYASNITTTGCTLSLLRTAGSSALSIPIMWIAMQ